MQRRAFLSLAFVPAMRAQHRIVSSDPVEWETDLGMQTGPFTSNGDFFVRNHWDAPEDIEHPVVRIEGLVEQPVILDTTALSKLPQRKIGTVLECAGNLLEPDALVSCGEWEGWLLRDILKTAGAKSGASWVHSFGRDGFSKGVPLERFLSGSLLATRLGGKPLDENHGKPWRAIFPAWYGMDSVKWLERMVLASAPIENRDGSYRIMRATASGSISRENLPSVQVKSIITSPANGRTLSRGLHRISGLAWAGESGVSSVAVNADGGHEWNPAGMEPARELQWRYWRADIHFDQPGVVEVICRATDGNGAVQPARRDPARRDGYANNWWHRVRYVVA